MTIELERSQQRSAPSRLGAMLLGLRGRRQPSLAAPGPSRARCYRPGDEWQEVMRLPLKFAEPVWQRFKLMANIHSEDDAPAEGLLLVRALEMIGGDEPETTQEMTVDACFLAELTMQEGKPRIDVTVLGTRPIVGPLR